MTDYDFKALVDKEFESLCADILGAAMNVRFERFKPGRDAGVDARCFAAQGEIILQCKHWANSPIKQLIRHLANNERQKVSKLNPKKYLLAVSNPLSRADKSAIRKALEPFVASDDDIYGKEDLNDLLAKHHGIELRHYKLWLTSSAVLSHIINKPIFDRSNFSIEEAIASVKHYVPTSSHARALQLLEQLHVIIITGEPGIGKTTLAEHLCLAYVTEKFELVRLNGEIKEAEAVFDPHKRQIFYFDDFLGRNYLQALSGHEGNQIVSFIQRVNKDTQKRFILTSRSTILNQGKVLIDNFRNKNIDRNEFELKIAALSVLDRAKILHSHVWHSNLGPEYVDEIYAEKRYRTVIRHRNYNPRLIEFITDSNRLHACPANYYWMHVQRTLENPADIWENALDAQQDDFGRAIVLLVALNRRAISQHELSEAYVRYVSMPQNQAMGGRRDFLLNLRHLTGSLLSRSIVDSNAGNASIKLFNPSIGDFVLRRYASDVPTMRNAFQSLRSLASLLTLDDLFKNKIVSEAVYADVLRIILRVASQDRFVGFDAEYVSTIAIQLVSIFKEVPPDELRQVVAAVHFVKAEKVKTFFCSTARFLRWGRSNAQVDDASIVRFILEACKQGASRDELEALVELLGDLDADSASSYQDASNSIQNAAVAYLADNLNEEVDEADVFRKVDYGDIEDAVWNLRSLVRDWFCDIGVECGSWDVQEIVDAYDIESRMHDHYDCGVGDYYESGVVRSASRTLMPSIQGSGGSGVDEIDDLFDRS